MAKKQHSPEQDNPKERQTAPEVDEKDLITDKSDATDAEFAEEPVEPTPAPESEPVVKASASDEAPQAAQAGGTKRFGRWLKHHKKVTIFAALVLVLIVLAAIPVSRYAIAGTFMKRDFKVKVVDQETGKPVSGAEVALGDKVAITDKDGKATVRNSVGYRPLNVQKKYYKFVVNEVLVPIGEQKDEYKVAIKATGRQVPVSVVNKITRKPLADATIALLDTETKTDENGKATLVLPADKTKIEGEVSKDGYNKAPITVTVSTKEEASNNFALTPEGKIFFLSNASGKLDVLQSNLDGSERKVVLAGTGKESKEDTILLASRDWKYLALQSRRDGGLHDKLFLIETATGKLTTMDEGDARFTIFGWSDHRFAYKVDRVKIDSYDARKYALKSYDAEAKKITTLDQTEAQKGQPSWRYYAAQDYSNEYLVDGKLIYTVDWFGSMRSPRPLVIRSVNVNGSDKKDIKSFDPKVYSDGYISSRFYAPGEVYFGIWNDRINDEVFFEYEDGEIVDADVDTSEFNRGYPTYFTSPSASHTFWAESRDGKNVFFIGDEHGDNEKKIASLKDYATYGWFTDDYVLVSKDNSELYIMSKDGLQDAKKPLKITNYHRPDYYIPGYGGGY